MKIAVACDHGALNLKNAVIAFVEKCGHEVVDFGTYTKDSCDYPDYARARICQNEKREKRKHRFKNKG